MSQQILHFQLFSYAFVIYFAPPKNCIEIYRQNAFGIQLILLGRVSISMYIIENDYIVTWGPRIATKRA